MARDIQVNNLSGAQAIRGMNFLKLKSKIHANRWLGRALLLMLLVVAAASFTASNVSSSRKIGRLSTTPTYDDVAYLSLASTFYFDMRSKRVLSKAFARDVVRFFTSYTHSPATVLLAILGFFVFGFGYIKVYYMLALVVFAYLAFVALICRRLPLPYLACVALASLGIPFATMASIEFRPDQLWTIFLTGSSVWFLTKGKAFASLLPSVVFGIMVGFAMLSKSSTFAMTFVVCGGSWFLAACIAVIGQKERFSRIMLGLAATVVAVFVTSGWYFIPHAGEIYGYFHEHTFGENKDVWMSRDSLAERMVYYLRGVPAQSNLGLFFLPLVALYLGGAIRDAIRPATLEDRLRGIALLWMLVCLYLVNGVPTVKSPYLGGSLYGFLIFGGLWYFSRLLRWCWEADEDTDMLVRLRLRGLTCLAVLAAALAAYRFPQLCTVNVPLAAERALINRTLVRDLLPESKSQKINLVLTQGSPVITEYIWMEFRKRRRPLEISNLFLEREFSTYLKASETADFILLQDPEFPGSPGYAIPSEQFQPRLLDHFRNEPGWSLAREYPVVGGKKIYLFARTGEKGNAVP